jgi:hypothetical protein
MTLTSDPIRVVRDLNPVPTGSVRELAAERADELLTRLRVGEVSTPSIRREHGRRRYLAVAVVAVAVAAAASVLTTQSGTPQQPPPAGTPVASAAQADALLSFNVVLPSDASPQYMNVYRWDGRELLAAEYDSASDGLYDLSEEPTTWTVTDLQQWANDWSTGSAQIVMVKGVHVLVGFDKVTPGGETDVAWIRGDGASPVITWLTGPWIEGQSFTNQQALSVAADIIGQGG